MEEIEKDVFNNWTFVHELGEGAFGEVKLAYNTKSFVQYAVKLIRHELMDGKEELIKKEKLIHQMLKHPNIVKYFGSRKTLKITYLFLEYASGGELYDRIEPDVGIAEYKCQRYYKEVLDAVDYMHDLGLAHRDIKPENILLDARDHIKLTDFGMSTMFRLNSKVRNLESQFGTAPYMAPEVMSGCYEATGIDMWSAGVVLVTMLAGQLPWFQPCSDCRDFHMFHCLGITNKSPFNRLPEDAKDLVLNILTLNVKKRYSSKRIRESKWFTKKIPLPEGAEKRAFEDDDQDNRTVKKLCLEDIHKSTNSMSQDFDIPAQIPRRIVCSQQPVSTNNDLFFIHGTEGEDQITADLSFFSQPTNTSNMLLTPSGKYDNLSLMERLVKRMTRFYVTTTLDETYDRLIEELDKMKMNHIRNSSNQVKVNIMEGQTLKLNFKIHLIDMPDNYLVDFRLSTGDGLHFKRIFLALRDLMKDIIKD